MQKQGLQQKQSQKLLISNSLKQSIALLNCNQQELDTLIEQILETNIMLMPAQQQAETIYESADDYIGGEDIPEEIDLDFDWKDVYEPEAMENQKVLDDTDGFQVDWLSQDSSFEQRLYEAINQAGFDKEQLAIVEIILNQLDDNYLLPITTSDSELAELAQTDEKTIAYLIDKIKFLDPIGVASRSIQECLLTQLIAQSEQYNQNDNTETFLNAFEIVKFYFDYIADKPSYIIKRLGIDEAQLKSAMELIRTLSPYPYISDESSSGQIRPDIYVHRKMGVYYASINRDSRHDLKINIAYSKLSETAKGDESKFLKAQIQDAKYFLKALDKRYSTILKVANVVVMQQQNYFIEGDKALVPFSMSEVANILDLNESTISRAVNNKYLSFKGQLIELRYFFSLNINKDNKDGQGYTAEHVKQRIVEIINSENKSEPFSDDKIVTQLELFGFEISRRTVAKYRDALGIAKVSERKRKS